MLHDRILTEKEQLDKKIAAIDTKLASLPDGKLICALNGKHYKWYCSDGHTPVYLPKKEVDLATRLAQKQYLLYEKEDLENQRTAITKYLTSYKPSSNKAEQLLQHPEYRKLLSPYFQPLSQELAAWASATYPLNDNHPKRFIHRTLSGHEVRSKAEAMIANALHNHKIPFRYECRLQLGNVDIHPDFTIRHPVTGELYYWEHFGSADKHNYAHNISSKLYLYITHNIIPSIQLITTYETKEFPLCSDTIEQIIQEYFL